MPPPFMEREETIRNKNSPHDHPLRASGWAPLHFVEVCGVGDIFCDCGGAKIGQLLEHFTRMKGRISNTLARQSSYGGIYIPL